MKRYALHNLPAPIGSQQRYWKASAGREYVSGNKATSEITKGFRLPCRSRKTSAETISFPHKSGQQMAARVENQKHLPSCAAFFAFALQWRRCGWRAPKVLLLSTSNSAPMKNPINLKKWIENNRDLLKPPVGNKNLYPEGEDYIVMVVGGPNARKDYHYNETEELFYQLEGSITVKIQEDGKAREIHLEAGDMFLLPPRVPHSPGRSAGSVGLVVERIRTNTDYKDGLLWFCEKCNHKLHETYFPLTNIEQDFLPRFREFYGSEEMRTCDNCGEVMEADERFV